MTQRRRPTPPELLEGLKEALIGHLPSTWSVEVTPRQPGGGLRTSAPGHPTPDATLTVRAPDGREATVPVEVTQRLDPKDVVSLMARLRQMMSPDAGERPIVVTPYVSPRTQELLAINGISHVATTQPYGIQFSLRDPSVYIETEHRKQKDPWVAPREQPLRTLRGPITGRVVRALCDFRPPYGVQQLAQRADVSISSVSRTLGLLETEALVSRTPRGGVTDVQWADLIRRWTNDRAFSESNAVQTYLAPRGLAAMLQTLHGVDPTDVRYAVTGSQAASVLAPVAAPRLLTIYVDRLSKMPIVKALGLRSTERGANVMLARPLEQFVFDRVRELDGIWYAAPSQVAADLLTGPGRSPSEAEALLDWMKDNEDAWRS